MALISKLKNMLGFSDSELEEEFNESADRDATVTPLKHRNYNADLPKTPSRQDTPIESSASKKEIAEIPTVVPDEIFEAVVKIFNDSLPDFLKSSVDADAQRKYIYDALSDSMKEYLNKLSSLSDQRMQQVWEEDRKKLNQEIEEIRQRSKKMEEANAEWKEQKLSAERQKRALSERVHDLEKQVDSFQAEKEQFELENKSLVNKLRAMSVQTDDRDYEATQSGVDTEKFVQINKENEELRAEAEKLRGDIETFKKRCEIADAMINDLNHKVSAARQELSEKESALAKANDEIGDRSDAEDVERLRAENSEMSEKLRLASEEIDAKVEEISNLNEELQMVREEFEESQTSLRMFEDTLTKFEDVKKKKDNQIAELQSAVNEKESLLKDKSAEIESLKSTIENNLKMQAASEAKLREEIENMKSSGEYDRPRRRKTAKPIAIDESLNDTDWLVSTPPPGSNIRLSSISDDEFGYQEPKRRTSPDDPAQMSLW